VIGGITCGTGNGAPKSAPKARSEFAVVCVGDSGSGSYIGESYVGEAYVGEASAIVRGG
jgi:hypothetical protein